MTFPSQGIFSKVKQVQEVTFNTLPATPTMTLVPFINSTLSPEITKVTDMIIQGDTMHRYVVPTTQKVGGTIGGEVSHANFDWLLQAMFYNTWATNTLVVGTTQSTYSIEVGATDISQYLLFTGCSLDKLALTLAPAGLVTYKADFIGCSWTISTTTNATATTGATVAAPLATVTATIKVGGTVVGWITGAAITFDRKLTPTYALGSASPKSLATSYFNVTGALDIFFEDAIAYGYFNANTSTTVDWTLTDGTNTYELILPNVYFETFTTDVTSSGPIKIKSNMTAVFDPSTSTNAKVIRSS